jgi:hypothetical protein
MGVLGFYNSLAEVLKLVDSVLVEGIVEQIIEEGQLIPKLPVTTLSGESLIYNRESTLPTADFYDIGDDLQEGASVAYSQVETVLKRLIGQWDLDKFNIKTYSNPNNLRAMAVSQCRKGVMRTAEDNLIYGVSSGKGFKGLHALVADTSYTGQGLVYPTVAEGMRIHQGGASAGAALSLANLDALVHQVKPKPDILLMNWNIWNKLSAVGRGTPVITRVREGGDLAQGVESYREVPIVVTDYITQTETVATYAYGAKTGGTASSIFALRFGSVEEGGVTLVTGNPMFDLENFDALETKDAERFRLIWYLTLALGSTRSLGVIDGITDAAVVV